MPKMVTDKIERRIFYVYVIFRLDGTPCYVGKGKGGRWRQHIKQSSNIHLARIYAKANGDLPIIKVRENLTNAQAIETEVALIAIIGRGKSGSLVNMTDGGDGATGYRHTVDTKTKLSTLRRSLLGNEDHRQRHRAALILAYTDPDLLERQSVIQKEVHGTPEARVKHSDIVKNLWANNPEYRAKGLAAIEARSDDPISLAKMIASQKALWDDDRRAEHSSVMTAIWTDERRDNQRAAQGVVWSDPEYKARQAAIQKAAWDGNPERQAAHSASRKGRPPHDQGPEELEKKSRSMRARYADPLERAKTSAAVKAGIARARVAKALVQSVPP